MDLAQLPNLKDVTIFEAPRPGITRSLVCEVPADLPHMFSAAGIELDIRLRV